MYQPKKEILHTCNIDIEKIGHNLDASNLNFSIEDNCERQISIFVNLLQARNNSFSLNHHTLHFGIFSALDSYCASFLTYLKEKTILQGKKVYFVIYNNINTNKLVVCRFQSDPQKNQYLKRNSRFSNREMSLLET